MQIGGLTFKTRFEVDTGYPPLSLTSDMWKALVAQVKQRGGWLTGEVSGRYGHVVNNCGERTIPDIFVTIGGQSLKIRAANFSIRRSLNQCLLYALILHPDHQYIYMGVPMLRSVETIFDAEKKAISFCF
jgi:hypothetical protein